MRTLVNRRTQLSRPGRSSVWAALLLAAAIFVTAIPTAWATPSEAPLDQTVPTIPPAPAPPAPSPGDGGDNIMPPAMPPIPYGGYLYYYVVGYGGYPSNYYPGYTAGGYWYPRTQNFYYPGGLYTPAPPAYPGYYYGMFW